MTRIPTLLVLILSLLTTAVSDAYARGAAPAVDRMVICSGMTTKVVHFDAQGKPTTPPHHCPDCTLAMQDALLPPLDLVVAPLGVSSMDWTTRAEHIAQKPAAQAIARGPPLPV